MSYEKTSPDVVCVILIFYLLTNTLTFSTKMLSNL